MIRYLAAVLACAFALQAHSATFTVTHATDAGATNSTVIPFGRGAAASAVGMGPKGNVAATGAGA